MYGKLQLMRLWMEEIDPKYIDVVLVHDAQDELTGEELKSVIRQFPDKQIQLVEGTYGSPGLARNAGIEVAKGDWLAFWDSDDSPNVEGFIEMVSRAEQLGYELAVGGYKVVDQSQSIKVSSNFSFPSLGDWGSNIPINPGIWRWAFRKELFENLRFEPFSMGEDQSLLVCIKPLSRNLLIYERSVYRYSTNILGQLTANKKKVDELWQSIIFLVKRMKSEIRSTNYFEAVILLRQCITAIRKARFKIKILSSVILLWTLISLCIFRIRVLITSIKCIFLFGIRDKKVPRLTEVFMLGGLGNQLFQIAAGLQLAAGNDLYVNYSAHSYSKDGFSDLKEFKLPKNVFIEKRFSYNILQKKFINLAIRLSSSIEVFSSKRKLYSFFVKNVQGFMGIIWIGKWKINKGVGFDPEFERSSANYALGYFQTHRYFNTPEVNKLLREISLVEPSQQFLYGQNELRNLDSLVVHIRLGDYLTEPDIGIPSLGYFHNSINRLWSSGNYSRVCLFSNDVSSAMEYVPTIFHTSLWIPNENLVSTSETLELMRYGKGYVLSNSSFSWWAAQLSYSDLPEVICPDPWFDKKSEPNDLIPERWARSPRLQ